MSENSQLFLDETKQGRPFLPTFITLTNLSWAILGLSRKFVRMTSLSPPCKLEFLNSFKETNLRCRRELDDYICVANFPFCFDMCCCLCCIVQVNQLISFSLFLNVAGFFCIFTPRVWWRNPVLHSQTPFLAFLETVNKLKQQQGRNKISSKEEETHQST